MFLNMRKYYIFLWLVLFFSAAFIPSDAKGGDFSIARVKYSGGGDWYSNPTSLPNLLEYLRSNTTIVSEKAPSVVETGSKEIFNYPYLYMNGHGRIEFSDAEAGNLRGYLLAGGFLHADDNYGMDKYFRQAMKKVFPEEELVEIPFNHPIYNIHFKFPHGLPKIHEHDGLPAQGFGIIRNGRLMVFYSYQSDLGDGWEDADVHNDPPEKREAALKMGVNIIVYAMTH